MVNIDVHTVWQACAYPQLILSPLLAFHSENNRIFAVFISQDFTTQVLRA